MSTNSKLPGEMEKEMSENSGSSCSFVTCYCGEVAPIRVSWTSKNPGRRFFGCKKYGDKGCNFFDWVDKDKDKNNSVAEEMKEVYHKMNSLSVQKEDLRAVAEGVKVLNTHLMKNMENERKKREEVQRKYDQCKKSLKRAKKWVMLLLLALLVSFVCNLKN